MKEHKCKTLQKMYSGTIIIYEQPEKERHPYDETYWLLEYDLHEGYGGSSIAFSIFNCPFCGCDLNGNV